MYNSKVILATLLSAVSAHVLKRTDDKCYAVSGPTCTDLVLGQKSTGKQVCTSISGSDLIVNYPAVDGYPYSEVHVYLGDKPPSKNAPGQFPFTSGNGYCKVAPDGSTATCTIPISEFGSCGGSYYIATHSAQGSETGWGNGECISNKCHPWAMYWGSPVQIECPPCSTPPASTTTTKNTPPVSTPSTTTKKSTPPATSPSTTTKKSTAPATKPSTTTAATPTPSYPACWTSCWTKNGVSDKEQACGNSNAKTCIDQTCGVNDKDAYHTWLNTDCAGQSSMTSLCESQSTPSPVVTSTACPKETSSISHSTYETTEYITTVLTSVVTKTDEVTSTYTTTGTCKATVTPAPIKYTTTCAA